MEKRTDPRVPHQIQARLEPGTFVGVTGDMSRRGIFLRSNSVLPIGTRLNLALHLPGGWAEAKGVVCWNRKEHEKWGGEPGMGIRLDAVSPELATYLAALAPEPALVPLAIEDHPDDSAGGEPDDHDEGGFSRPP